MGLLASTASAGHNHVLSADPDVVSIGAGTTCIAAARALSRRGVEILVLKAADRIGGRAHTESAIFGAPYDHGYASLQGPEMLPHVPLARAHWVSRCTITRVGMVGSDAQRHFVKGHLSEQETNPLALGEHVFFAGEATASPYAALCSGAHLSVERSAAVVADQLTASGACSSCDARGRQRTRLIGGTE